MFTAQLRRRNVSQQSELLKFRPQLMILQEGFRRTAVLWQPRFLQVVRAFQFRSAYVIVEGLILV